MAKPLSVNHLLERAVVKVLINDTFKGSGFFISPDYVLTAYHCLETLADGQDIYVENQTYGRMRVLLEREKSLPDPKQDIAVLQLVDKEVADFLPLGVVNETQRGDEILAVGYPAGILSFISGEIHGFPEEFPQQFFNNAMKAKGQSGGVVYHPTLRRVVGIALELYHQIVVNGGLAGRFDVLLRQWTELKSLNQQAIDRWDNLLQPKPLLSKPIVMTWGGVIAAVVLGVWLLLGRGEQQTIIAPNSNVTAGNKLIDNTVVNNNTYYGISEEVFAKYATNLGVTDDALDKFFEILKQAKVDRTDLKQKLQEIADRYNRFLENAKLLEGSDDPKVNDLLRQAREFIEGKDAKGNSVTIDFAKAEGLLQQATEQVQQRGGQLREVTEKANVAEEKNQLLETRILAQQGDLAATQLKYADAGSYYQQAAEKLPAGHEEDKAKYLNDAGVAFHEAGKYEQALPLLREALKIREQVLGRQHPDYAQSLNNLASLYYYQGQYEQALSLLKEALQIQEQILGKQHPSYATSLNNLAYLYNSQGQYEQALPLYQEALTIEKEVLSKQHPLYAQSLNNLALLHQARGEYEQALPLLKEALQIREQVLGKQHPDYADSLNDLATLYHSQGQYEQALPLVQEALEIWGKVLGKESPNYASSLNNLAKLYQAQGKYEEALPLFREVLKITEQVGKHHPDYATSLNNLALLYDSHGKYEEALPLYEEALKIREQVLGKQHPDYATSLNNLAGLYDSQGQYEQALPLYQEALGIEEQVLGKLHPDYATSLNNLALLYKSQGQYEQALPLVQESLKVREEVLGKEHPDYATSLNNLALLYDSQGKYEEALPLYEEALKIREQVLGKLHPDYASSLNNLAVLYYLQGKYEEALPLFQQAVEIQTKALGEKHPESQLFAKNLRSVQDYLNGKYQVIIERVLPDSPAAQLGIQVGDIFTHYDQQPILGRAQFIQGRAEEPANGAAKELTVLRDGKSLTFQLKPGKIGVELEEELKPEP